MAKLKQGEKSKTAMVIEALEALGWNAKNDALVEYILNNFGVTMTKSHVSQTKSILRRRGKKKTGRRGRPRKDGKVSSSSNASASPSFDDLLTLLNSLHKLRDQFGEDHLQKAVKAVLKS
jgi:hypothetical protein